MNMKMPWRPWSRNRAEEWREEVDAHLALRGEWNRAAGMPEDEARRAAKRQFGNRLLTLDAVRDVHIRRWLDDFLQDARVALRGFRKSPTVALVAIATIAIGVGASTAIFGVVDPLLFRKLPYPDDGQLVSIGYFGPVDDNEFNVATSYLDWRREQTPFQSMTSMRPAPASNCDLMAEETPLRVTCVPVEANFLGMFGLRPAIGRDFSAQDDQLHAPPVALLSYALWRRNYGGNARIVGQAVTVDDQRVTVIGVLPRDFEMPQLGSADILMPERLDPTLPHGGDSAFLRTFARLRPGVSLEEARARMQPLFDRTTQLDVPKELRSEVHLVVRSLRDRQIQSVKLASWMLLGAVLTLLLLVCANVANLLLARAAARRRELAVRAAIGAGRARLVRQLLTESSMLALAGGALGCGIAWAMLRALVALAPPDLLRAGRTSLDARVLLFALAVSLAAALLFGIAPALERPRAEALAGSRVSGGARTIFRKLLVAAQVAISLVLLTGASLFVRSFRELQREPLGYEPEHLVTASFALRSARYGPQASQAAFFRGVEDRLKWIPGGLFALSDSIPPRGSMGRPYSNIRIANHPPVAADGGMVEFRWVTPGYFRTMGIRIVSGRAFEESQRADADSPVILSASLARRLFGSENPVGQRLALDGDAHWCPIVGVAADTRNNGLTETDPEYYRLRMSDGAMQPRSAVALFRTPLATPALERWVRKQVAEVDPSLPVTFEAMPERVGRFRQQPLFVASLVASFALIGLLLAAVGLYGVLSFLVAQQTREIGIRMALGARPRDIAAQIQSYAGAWTGIGACAGILCSLAATRMVKGLLFGVAPDDAFSLVAAVAALFSIAALAAWIPSRRAARVDPMIALRYE